MNKSKLLINSHVERIRRESPGAIERNQSFMLAIANAIGGEDFTEAQQAWLKDWENSTGYPVPATPEDILRLAMLAGFTPKHLADEWAGRGVFDFPSLLSVIQGGLQRVRVKLTPGHPGHSKNNSAPPEDVLEVNKMMLLKRWQGKTPIEVCRAYILAKHKNARDEFIETQSQSLKRKRNRYAN